MNNPTPGLAALIPIVLATTVVPLSGCSSDDTITADTTQPVIAPEAFDDESTSSAWIRRDSLTDFDTDRLLAYFRRHPSVAEHSIVQGDPLVYSDGDQRQRYYWVRPGRQGAEWLCLEFDRRRAALKDGNGLPFLGGG